MRGNTASSAPFAATPAAESDAEQEDEDCAAALDEGSASPGAPEPEGSFRPQAEEGLAFPVDPSAFALPFASEDFDDPPFDPPEPDDEIFGGGLKRARSSFYPEAAFEPNEEAAHEATVTDAAAEDHACTPSEPVLTLDTLHLSIRAEDAPDAAAPLDLVTEVPTGIATDAPVAEAPLELVAEVPPEADAREAAAPFDPPDADDEIFAGGAPQSADLSIAEPEAAPEAPTQPEVPAEAIAPAPESAPTAPAAARLGARPNEPPAPPIVIHASWDRPETADLLTAFAADKRLARAEIAIARGGLDGAILRYASQPSPDLLILDTTLSGEEMLDSVDRLIHTIGPRAKVVVLGAVNDIGIFRDLAVRGVSEYIVPPIGPEDMAGAVCRLFAHTDRSRVFAIIGARGGVGASTIAHNLAWSIAERQKISAALVDLDLSFGTAAFRFDQAPSWSVDDALRAPARVVDAFLDRVIVKYTERLNVLPAAAALERESELDAQALHKVLKRVRRISPFVILDLPHAWSPGVMQALSAADEALVVAAPELASLRDARNMLDRLTAERGERSPPSVVLSMVGMPERPEIRFKDFADALGASPIASFAHDPILFAACEINARMVGEVAPHSKAAKTFDALAATLTGRQPVALEAPSGRPLLRLLAGGGADDLSQQDQPAAKASILQPRKPARIKERRRRGPAPEADDAVQMELPLKLPPIDPFLRRPAEADVVAAPPETARQLELPLDLPPAPVAQPASSGAAPLPAAEAPAKNEYLLKARDAARRELIALIHPPPKQASPRRRIVGAAACLMMILLIGGAWYMRTQRADEPAAPSAGAKPRAAARVALPPARASDPVARYEFALTLLEVGRARPAALIIRRLAEAGYPMAQYRLARLYERGEGVEPDVALARRWTERAAAAGDRNAMHDLGVYYARGEGSPVDEQAAFRWFRQAAELGVADSQYNLGVLYRQGRGVSADAHEALFWFLVAAQHGDGAAAAGAAALEAQVSGVQAARAKERAQAFRPRAASTFADRELGSRAWAGGESDRVELAAPAQTVALSRDAPAAEES